MHKALLVVWDGVSWHSCPNPTLAFQARAGFRHICREKKHVTLRTMTYALYTSIYQYSSLYNISHIQNKFLSFICYVNEYHFTIEINIHEVKKSYLFITYTCRIVVYSHHLLKYGIILCTRTIYCPWRVLTHALLQLSVLYVLHCRGLICRHTIYWVWRYLCTYTIYSDVEAICVLSSYIV